MAGNDVEDALRTCKETYEREVAEAVAAVAARRDATLREAVEAGLSYYRIAQLTGYSREHISTILGPR
jgi:hypothetical protein